MTAEHDEMTTLRRLLQESERAVEILSERNARLAADLENALALIQSQNNLNGLLTYVGVAADYKPLPLIEAPETGLTQETEHA